MMKKAMLVGLVGLFGLIALPSCCCKKSEKKHSKAQDVKMCKGCGMPKSKCSC